ncbi:MAG TPA: TetR/AcrR family transcriptional regulator C-terminal domain-containing protein [Pseudonocardiaceae bacterium]
MPRPSTPLLSPERIRRTALAILDREGLAALSMRRLAQELGVRAASLYNHVATKDELLDQIASEIMEQVDTSAFAPDSPADWRAALITWGRSYRAALAAHPNIVPYLAYGPAHREASLRRADEIHGGLTRAGWPPRYATMIGAAVKYLVIGAAMGSFARGFIDDATLYAGRFPHLTQAHLLRAHAERIDQDSFELALHALVDGLSAQYEQVVLHHSPEDHPEPAGQDRESSS